MVAEKIGKIEPEIYAIWNRSEYTIDNSVDDCVKQNIWTHVRNGVVETIWFEIRDCVHDQARRDLTW